MLFFGGGVGAVMSKGQDRNRKKTGVVITDRKVAKGLLPKRQRNSHKGTYGAAAIIAGSEDYTGAAYLSAAACLRSGVGYTFLFTPKNILPRYALKSPEVILKPISDGGRYEFNEEIMQGVLQFDAIAYGMGMGVSEEVFQGAAYLLTNYTGKLILDADGLNSLAQFASEDLEGLFTNKKCDVIITPHIKEFSRLSKQSMEEILENSQQSAVCFAKKYGVTVLLKNAFSVITNGEQVYLNVTGNSGQAKGGSGDVLSGIIAGLCATGLNSLEGGVLGAYLAGKSAELGVADFGEYSLTASELIAYLPKAFLSLA